MVALLLTTPEWDMSAGSVAGILLAVALVFAAAGGLLWLPAARWLSDPARRAPGAVQALTFAGLGVAIGFVTTILAFLVLGGLTAPGASVAGVLGPALQASAVAAAASLIGWLLAQAPGRIARRPRQRAA